MAAKLLKHFGIGSSKKVSDQPCQGDFVTAGKATTTAPASAAAAAAAAAAATTGSVQELRSTSPSKTNRASAAFVVTSNSWLGSGGTGPDPGPAAPGAGDGAGADGRRHSDASTIRSFRSRLPSHLKADLSFRGLSSRSTVTPAPRRDPCCEVGGGGGGGGRGAKSPCADRTDCLLAENDESKKSIFSQPQIATEYSNPFDLKQQGTNDVDSKSDVKAWSSEDDYSVPYEGQTDGSTLESKPSDLDAKKPSFVKAEVTSSAEDAAHIEPSTPPSPVISNSDAAVIAEISTAVLSEDDGPEGNVCVVESDNVLALELEQKSDGNVDSAFDGSSPDVSSASGGTSQPLATGLEPVLTDPSAGMYDAPWDLCATQKNLEEKLLRASLTPPSSSSSGSDPRVPNFGPKETTRGVKNSASESDAMQFYDEPWDRKAENFHQSFSAANAGKECGACSSLATPNQKYRTMIPNPNGTFWRERSLHGKSCKGVGEHQKVRSGVRTGVSSCYPFQSSFCALHSDSSTMKPQSRHHHDYRHSTIQHRREAVDECLPLEKQSWYHGAISRVAAESLLRCHRQGSYLVRMSESDRKDYSLSVKSSSGEFMHMKIVRHESGFILGQFSQPFASIPQMILYYTINKLPIRGTEHMTLSFPVCSELLL